jgi:hypothetical protein
MSRRKAETTGAMLELWRPSKGAGDPIGCLTTTYTFHTGLFDEQCLARFLEIESEPNREELPFLLERESRLGAVYAGVLVDHSQAGVEHSYRWDVLPVRVPGGKQHAKVSLLVWDRQVRIIVASANLTEQGYRSNYEVAVPVDVIPTGGNIDLLQDTLTFLRRMIRFVPAASFDEPFADVVRVTSFLNEVEKRVKRWTPDRRRASVRQHFVYTMPAAHRLPQQGSLEEAFALCRARGGSPTQIWLASPFFDSEAATADVSASLCKAMARGADRKVTFCVPATRDDEQPKRWRIAAPNTLIKAAQRLKAEVTLEALPDRDVDKNLRPWHAKMVAFKTGDYSALMVGSSNFTTAGMGISGHRFNIEANLLTIVDEEAFARDAGRLESLWPGMDQIVDPAKAEWRGPDPEKEEEEQATKQGPPKGFLAASYRAGRNRAVILLLDPPELPDDWTVSAAGRRPQKLADCAAWKASGREAVFEIEWSKPEPPEKLVVRWPGHEGLLPLNVEDRRELPPPAELDHMTADDMLGILAASDPSAAFRAWAKRQHRNVDEFDSDLDSATPIDLDPLRRYDIHATFLHRVRHRARVLAQLRANLERPVPGAQALDWRLRGLVGIEPLAERLVRELSLSNGRSDESLLTLADFLIVLSEVNYVGVPGSLSKVEFDALYSAFLRELAGNLTRQVDSVRHLVSAQPIEFWQRVIERCDR